VGKEVFSMEEEEDEEDLLEMEDGEDFSSEGRPGTTKRKQYYFKKVRQPGITKWKQFYLKKGMTRSK
jgi:hypothetical protein